MGKYSTYRKNRSKKFARPPRPRQSSVDILCEIQKKAWENHKAAEKTQTPLIHVKRGVDLGDSFERLRSILYPFRGEVEYRLNAPNITLFSGYESRWAYRHREEKPEDIQKRISDYVETHFDYEIGPVYLGRIMLLNSLGGNSGNRKYLAFTFDQDTREALIEQREQLFADVFNGTKAVGDYKPHVTVAITPVSKTANTLFRKIESCGFEASEADILKGQTELFLSR